MLEVLRRIKQAAHFLATQDDRQGAGHAHGVHLGHQLGLTEGCLE